VTTIKKTAVLVIMAAVLLTQANAEEKPKNYSFSIAPLLGVIYGSSEEIVYKNSDSNRYNSELVWDLKPLFYAGFAIDAAPFDIYAKNGFIAAASFKYGFPLRTGFMVDRDWQYDNNSGLTNYSRHDAISRNAFFIDLSAGYSLPLTHFLSFSAFVEFTYMYLSWTAQDGYYQYLASDSNGNIIPGQVWDNQIPKKSVVGTVIKYEQNWYLFSPGISLKGRFNNIFSLEGFFSYSPLIFCSDKDEHILRSIVFYDYPRFGHYIKGTGKFTVSPFKNVSFSSSLLYRYITGSRGDIKTRSFLYKDISGAGYSALDLELALRIRF
jgi:outer membrane protease